jgi:hypothetical protein
MFLCAWHPGCHRRGRSGHVCLMPSGSSAAHAGTRVFTLMGAKKKARQEQPGHTLCLFTLSFPLRRRVSPRAQMQTVVPFLILRHFVLPLQMLRTIHVHQHISFLFPPTCRSSTRRFCSQRLLGSWFQGHSNWSLLRAIRYRDPTVMPKRLRHSSSRTPYPREVQSSSPATVADLLIRLGMRYYSLSSGYLLPVIRDLARPSLSERSTCPTLFPTITSMVFAYWCRQAEPEPCLTLFSPEADYVQPSSDISLPDISLTSTPSLRSRSGPCILRWLVRAGSVLTYVSRDDFVQLSSHPNASLLWLRRRLG